MLRAIFLIWAGPLILFSIVFGTWYFLSYNDINFGSIYLSRMFHDLYFQMVGDMVNMPPESIPPLLATFLVVDLIITISVGLLLRYRTVWWPKVKTFVTQRILGREVNESEPAQRDPIATAIGQVHPAE